MNEPCGCITRTEPGGSTVTSCPEGARLWAAADVVYRSQGYDALVRYASCSVPKLRGK